MKGNLLKVTELKKMWHGILTKLEIPFFNNMEK